MEGARRFEAPKKKVFPVSEDLSFYVNALSRRRLEQRKRQDAMQNRLQESVGSLTVRERTVLATKVGDGEVMPFMTEALDELDHSIADLDSNIFILNQGKKDIAAGRIPKWKFVELFDKLREQDELAYKGKVVHLHALRLRHAEGERLSKGELSELSKLPGELEAERDRLIRLRQRSEVFHEIYKTEGVHPAMTREERRSHLERNVSAVASRSGLDTYGDENDLEWSSPAHQAYPDDEDDAA
jgi:hypothetical protein